MGEVRLTESERTPSKHTLCKHADFPVCTSLVFCPIGGGGNQLFLTCCYRKASGKTNPIGAVDMFGNIQKISLLNRFYFSYELFSNISGNITRTMYIEIYIDRWEHP